MPAPSFSFLLGPLLLLACVHSLCPSALCLSGQKGSVVGGTREIEIPARIPAFQSCARQARGGQAEAEAPAHQGQAAARPRLCPSRLPCSPRAVFAHKQINLEGTNAREPLRSKKNWEQSVNPSGTGTSGRTMLRSDDEHAGAAAAAAAKTGTAAPGAEVRHFASGGGWLGRTCAAVGTNPSSSARSLVCSFVRSFVRSFQISRLFGFTRGVSPEGVSRANRASRLSHDTDRPRTTPRTTSHTQCAQ